MLHHLFDDTPWFRAKRFGYGAGLPIAWQGWLLLAAHMALIVGVMMLFRRHHSFATILLLGITTLAPLPIYRRHTQGGWRWR